MSPTPWLVLGWICVGIGAVVLAAGSLTGSGRLTVMPEDRETDGADPGRRSRGLALGGTVLLALGAFSVVSGLLLGDATGASDALRTGGLAAASVLAVHWLWLADRRRRGAEDRQRLDAARARLDEGRYQLEQARQELDRQRVDNERDRTSDSRFAAALELLGHDADQVRVGALHALAGLARNRPQYAQTTLDILCAYLRRPFDHPSYAARRAAGGRVRPPVTQQDDHWQDVAGDRERQVRLTAQRLIVDLLPSVSDRDSPNYHLDLTGAALEYFDLSHKRIGSFTARSAHFYEAASFEGAVFHGPIWLTWAHMWGDTLRANDMVAAGIAWLSNFVANGAVEFDRTDFRGATKFAYAAFHDQASFQGCRFAEPPDFHHAVFAGSLLFSPNGRLIGRTTGMKVSLRHEVLLPAGWVVDPQHSTEFGLIRG